MGTFIEIRCDDASRALKSHTAQHRLLLDSGRINDIKKKVQVRIKKKERRKERRRNQSSMALHWTEKCLALAT